MGGVVAGFILYTIYSYKPYTQSLPWEGLLQVLYILKALCIVFLYQSNDALRFANPVFLGIVLGVVLKSSKEEQWTMRDAM